MKGASFKAGAGKIHSAFLPVPVLAPVLVLELELELELEPAPEPAPVPELGAVLAPLAPLALGRSPSVGDASHVPFAPG